MIDYGGLYSMIGIGKLQQVVNRLLPIIVPSLTDTHCIIDPGIVMQILNIDKYKVVQVKQKLPTYLPTLKIMSRGGQQTNIVLRMA
jgi:hypothetical protein